MSTSDSPRPLPYVPFVAADAGLLLIAGLIAWHTPAELTGGPLLGVVICAGLGAVLAVLPFVLNDAHQRDAALAERQKELADLVTTSNAHASRWGTQWAAAATGLQEAADLASRSLAAVEQLPAVMQEKTDALAQKLTEAEQLAQARAERAAHQESALLEQFAAQLAAQKTDQLTQIGALDSALTARETTFAQQMAQQADKSAHLAEQTVKLADQFAGQVAVLTAQVAPLGTASAEFKTTLLEFARLEASVREQRAAITATLAEFPVAAAQAQTARAELAETLAAAPAQLAAEVERRVSEAEVRLGTTTTALTSRLADVESALTGLVAQLQRAAEAAAVLPVAVSSAPSPAPILIPAITPAVTATETAAVTVAAPTAPEEVHTEAVLETAATVVVVESFPSVVPATVIATPVKPEKNPVRSETIMDPFIIPANGYAALADAMDLGDV